MRDEAAGAYPLRVDLLRSVRHLAAALQRVALAATFARIARAAHISCPRANACTEPHRLPLRPSRSGPWIRLLAGAGIVFSTLALSTADARLLAAQQVPTPPAPAPAVAPTETATDTLARGPYRSPRGAFIRSVVLPGWGQAWVGAPGRGSVYFAMEAGSAWMFFKTQSRLTDARRRFEYLESIQTVGADTTALHQARTLVKSRAKQRESWIALGVFLLFFSGADAYVAAQLADFEERIALEPRPEGGLNIGATIPVGARR